MTMLSSGSATDFVRFALAGSPGPARLLGSFPTACYLELASGAVVAVLTSDAVRLPIGVTLPWPSSRLDLRALAPAEAAVRPAEIRLGRLRVTLTGRWDAALRCCGRPVRVPDVALGRWLDPFGDPSLAVRRLLGRGPGLTPAGDDLICGALAATRLFGLAADRLADAVRDRLAGGSVTTSLSRQLLLRAADGDGLPELQRLAEALCDPDPRPIEPALRDVLRIGHSSGAALAAGLLAGARQARAVPVAA